MMLLAKYISVELIFFGSFVLWMHSQIYAEELCLPGGTQVFDWTYESDAIRLETSWFWNGTELMKKVASGDVIINPKTQFAGRIWEYNQTNCGLIIFDVKSNDTGTFEVIVKFKDGVQYNVKETLSVSKDAAEAEVQTNAEIFINDSRYDVPDENYLGVPPLYFTFNLTKTCITPPIIRINYNNKTVKECPNEYICSQQFNDPGEVTLNIAVGSEDIKYPKAGEKPFTIGLNETDSSDEPKERSCHEKVECIVPATVVPIGFVLIAVITTLAIKKPCSE